MDETVKDALIRELVGLGALALILFALGPGRVWIPAWIARAKTAWHPADAHEGQVRRFAREVSEWEHEQVAKQDRPPAASGPCGCG